MKLRFTIHDSRFTIWKKSSESAVAGHRPGNAGNRQSSIVSRKSEQGIALVITLILLSVTLVMAIAFLAISRREAGSVATSTDTVTARLAADAALANAQAQIIASVLASQDPYNTGLLVSTNYVNGIGFTTTGAGVTDPTNINYDFINGGGPYTVADFEQNVANLLYLPRAPVFVPNPMNSSLPADFRFYLDLNRNGRFETNGVVGNYDNNGNYLGTITEVGDPEWVGVLERPDVPHGPNNKFVSRYAFMAVPADGSLDLNAIHNQALHSNGASPSPMNPPPIGDVFLRNQGVGSWEINLAAFLADLNTNEWGQIVGSGASAPAGSAIYYQYNQPENANSGHAFEDALALLAFRYFNDYASLPFAPAVLPASFLPGAVDIFPLGNPLMTGTTAPFYNFNLNNIRYPGADNTNHYFAESSDLFNPNKVEKGVPSPGFIERLNQAGNAVSTYDRYTFYRMLAQLGTDSAPAQNQVNLNYSNAVAIFNSFGVVTNIAYFANAQTNLVPWQPLQFFTIAADRLLREYSTAWFQSDPSNYLWTYYGIATNYYYEDSLGNFTTNASNGAGLVNVPFFGLTNQIPSFGITNIPVMMNGQFAYTPAVQRVLQLVANIYDATTNQAAYLGKDYPSVFRPVFCTSLGFSGVRNVSIVGYEYITLTQQPPQNSPPLDPPNDITWWLNNSGPAFPYFRYNLAKTPLSQQANANIYGVPWIIGAKKGFPNFNEFSMQDVVKVTRKLQLKRLGTNSPPYATNQMYVFSVTNSLGVEFWNSYTNGYTNLTGNNILLAVNDQLAMRMILTNGTVLTADGHTIGYGFPNTPIYTNFSVWPGNTFIIPFATNFPVLMDSAYSFPYTEFYYVGDNPNPTFQATTPTFAPLPQILLQVTNYLQAFMLDKDVNGNSHVIDYVHFTGPGSSRNLNSEFQNTNVLSVGSPFTNLVWSTAPDNTGLPLGITTQIGISSGSITNDSRFWNDPNAPVQIDSFRHFLNPLYALPVGEIDIYSTNLAVQAPYTPTAITYEYTTYQANDPLVHYLRSDLEYSGYDPNNSSLLQTGVHQEPANTPNFPLLPGLAKVNARYQPWGKLPPNGQAGVSQNTYDESPYNLAFKDPLVTSSDNWDFPSYKLPNVGWLGRVHRGTPWQTVYMKASDILAEPNPANQALGNVGTNTWAVWTSDADPYDAVNAAPVQDRLLFDNFSTALDDNATRGQLSVNQDHLAAWSAVLSGVVAITNSDPYPQYAASNPTRFPLTNSPLIINPAGPFGTNSVLGQIVNGINATRQNFKNNDGLAGAFEHVGDILAAPQLTEQSPFLNWNDANQQQKGISDEVYEWLPQQTMSLLRVPGTPQSPLRYVIYSYGQTLKPAPGGVVTSGGQSFFQMVTNYQVVAETATRTVVRLSPVLTTNLNGTLNTNYNSKIEQFNVLGPD